MMGDLNVKVSKEVCDLVAAAKKIEKEQMGREFASPHEAWARLKELSEEIGDAGKTIGTLQGDIWKAIRAGNDEEVMVELRQVGNLAMQTCATYARLAAEALRAADELPL